MAAKSKFTGELLAGRMAPKTGDNWTFSVEYYAERIAQHWHQARDSIFAVAKLLVEVKHKKLEAREWEDLKRELPFSDSVIKKLLVIGDRRSWLQKPSLYKRLPSNYSTIYEIATLRPPELEAAQNEGQISTRMRRKAFIAWRQNWRSTQGGRVAVLPAHLRLRVLGWSTFAEILTDGSLSNPKAIQLTQELNRVGKRYGVHVRFSVPARKAKADLIRELQEKLNALVAPYNSEMDPQQRRLIDTALWQHRGREAGKGAKYAADCASSIENKNHPYSVHNGWNSKRLLSEMNERRIITTRLAIKDRPELGEARCLQLAIWYLETSDANERQKHKKALQRVARAKSEDSKIAESFLNEITPFEGIGLQ
jgi:hypothetical protein